MNVTLLRRLREAGGAFLPLDVLSAATGHTGLMRDLDELIEFGFAIERHPYLGAAYRGPAQRLCPDQIEYDLGTRLIGRRVAVWDRVASTNDLAARAAHSEANEGLVVLAEEQSAGRGRRGRVWSAPPRASILMSVLLFPDAGLCDPAWLTAMGAVAVAEVVSEWARVEAAIKWPNDVRVGGRKIAGILVERGAGAVIGIGLNANTAPEDFPADLREAATSLRTVTGSPVDRSELARDLIRRLDAHHENLRRDGAAALNRSWRTRSEHLGRFVTVSTPRGACSGTLDDLDLSEGVWLTALDGSNLRIPPSDVLAITPSCE